MIFVTVGAQMPFDRLIRVVDEWAGRRHRADVFAQIGPTRYRPRHIEHSRFIAPGDYQSNIDRADTIVSHAGMGTIISAVENHKPILVMPRRSDLGETRNDHQIATARQFSALRLVEVAMDEQALLAKLDAIDEIKNLAALEAHRCAMCPSDPTGEACHGRAPNAACPHLLAAIADFIEHGTTGSKSLPPAGWSAAPIRAA